MWRPQSRYTVSRIECRIKFPQNQRCRAKIALHPPKSTCRTFLRTPLSHFPLIRSRQGARWAGGGYRGTFGFRKRIGLQGDIAATVTPVALLRATKSLPWQKQSPFKFTQDRSILTKEWLQVLGKESCPGQGSRGISSDHWGRWNTIQ